MCTKAMNCFLDYLQSTTLFLLTNVRNKPIMGSSIFKPKSDLLLMTRPRILLKISGYKRNDSFESIIICVNLLKRLRFSLSLSRITSTGVLIYQARQEKVAEERSHLTLQLNLLTEQKIAKLIALVEELRTDLPNVRNRHDSEAFEMQKTTNPQVVLNALKETLNAATIMKEEEDTMTDAHPSSSIYSPSKHDEELN